MGRYTGKTCRLLVMLSMTASFFFVEIVVGYIVNSLALVGDSYHMLSDVIALGVGFASVRISKWNSQKNTYGWARAEVLGALVNSVFLVALCFTIFVSAMERLFTDEHIHDPDMMIIVGAIGLAVNIIGLLLFQGHAHSHGGGGGHGHSHGGDDSHGHSHEGPHSPGTTEKLHLATNGGGPAASSSNGDVLGAGASSMQAGAVGGKESDDERHSSGSDDDMEEEEKKLQRSAAQLNMKAVFLHVLGDALGSVIVIISALVIKYVKADWAHKVDPALSIVLVLIILCTTATVLRDSALILLQTVPHHIQVKDLHDKLIQKVDGVLAVHEFHIWQLAGNRIIASAHIRCQNLRDYMRIAEEVKTFFHQEGIHSTTIQPEFVECLPPALQAQVQKNECLLDCCGHRRDKCCEQDPFQERGRYYHSCSSLITTGSCQCIAGSRESNVYRRYNTSTIDGGMGDGVDLSFPALSCDLGAEKGGGGGGGGGGGSGGKGWNGETFPVISDAVLCGAGENNFKDGRDNVDLERANAQDAQDAKETKLNGHNENDDEDDIENDSFSQDACLSQPLCSSTKLGRLSEDEDENGDGDGEDSNANITSSLEQASSSNNSPQHSNEGSSQSSREREPLVVNIVNECKGKETWLV